MTDEIEPDPEQVWKALWAAVDTARKAFEVLGVEMQVDIKITEAKESTGAEPHP